MPFILTRTVRFQDTDAAGVVYFANVLAMCHEAYEASLAASGILLKAFFRNPELAVPITQAQVDFYRPLFCGDVLAIHLTPKPVSAEEFEINYQIFSPEFAEKCSAKARTKHVCIDPQSRQRIAFSEELQQWLNSFESLL